MLSAPPINSLLQGLGGGWRIKEAVCPSLGREAEKSPVRDGERKRVGNQS